MFSKLDKAKARLVSRHPLYASVLLGMPLRPQEDLAWWQQLGLSTGTMATNGVNIFYYPPFVESLPVEQVMTVLAHEALHVMLLHPWRRQTRHPILWNTAADYAENSLLYEAGFAHVPGILHDAQFAGKSAEQIYNELKKKAKNATAPSFDVVLDAPGNEAEKQKSEADAKIAVAKAVASAREAGKLPSNVERLITEVLQPPSYWPDLLRKYALSLAQENESWHRPARRHIHAGMYLPSLYSEAFGEIVVVVDTSGSTTNVQNEFAMHMSSIIHDCKPEKTYVISADAKVQHVDIFGPGDEVVFNFRGGGGTDFRPVFEYLEQEGIDPAVMVFLTDLEGTFPSNAPYYPVIWAATTAHTPPFGEVVRVL